MTPLSRQCLRALLGAVALTMIGCSRPAAHQGAEIALYGPDGHRRMTSGLEPIVEELEKPFRLTISVDRLAFKADDGFEFDVHWERVSTRGDCDVYDITTRIGSARKASTKRVRYCGTAVAIWEEAGYRLVLGPPEIEGASEPAGH